MSEKKEDREMGEREPHEAYGRPSPDQKEGVNQEIPPEDDRPENWDPARGAGTLGGRRQKPARTGEE